MSRPLRIEYPGAWYHVMNRGRRREKIYFEGKDYKTFLEVLKQACKLFSIEIHAYVFMPNHYHLLIRTLEANLSRVMRHINGVYTQKFNKKNKIDGSIFRGRYKAILVEEESYLLELVRYIHKNPLKSRLEEKIGEYKWCSHRGYVKDKYREEWLKTNCVLGKFSQYEKEAKKELEAFVLGEIPKDIIKRLEGTNWPSVMGGEKFKKKMREYLRGKEIKAYEIPDYKKEMKAEKDKARKIKKIEDKYGDVLEKRGSRRAGTLRRALIYILRKEAGLSLSEIAEIAGGVKYTAISNQYRKAEEEIRKKTGCFIDVEEVTGILSVK